MATLVQDDWNQHWDKFADAAEENPAQRYRRRRILDLLGLSRKPAEARVLDVGSGQGDFSRDLSKTYPQAKLLGLELSQSGVAISKHKVPTAEFIQQDLMEPKEPPAEYKGWATHAVCSEMLEHVEEPAKVLRNIRPYLADDCRLVITVPGGPMSAFDKHIGHRKHYTRAELQALLKEAGYQVETVYSAGFPFMNLYRLVVIARGEALIQDVNKDTDGGVSPLARLAMALFRPLFRLNLPQSPWGWQMIAVARKA